MAINTCDFCNNDAVVRFMINDLPGAESCACAIHKEEAEKRVDSYNKRELKTVPVGDNGKVFHRVEGNVEDGWMTVDETVQLVNELSKAHRDGKLLKAESVEFVKLEDTPTITASPVKVKALSDDEAERYANRLWEFLLPKVLREMTNLLHKEPIMSPDGTEIRGWVDRAPWQEPVIDVDQRRVAQSPEVDIMDRYGLWTDNQFEDHRRCANDQLRKTREVLKGFIHGKENKEMS